MGCPWITHGPPSSSWVANGLPMDWKCWSIGNPWAARGSPGGIHGCPMANVRHYRAFGRAPMGAHGLLRAPTCGLVGSHGTPRGRRWDPAGKHAGAHGRPLDSTRDSGGGGTRSLGKNRTTPRGGPSGTCGNHVPMGAGLAPARSQLGARGSPIWPPRDCTWEPTGEPAWQPAW